jgi:hypothetical protein
MLQKGSKTYLGNLSESPLEVFVVLRKKRTFLPELLDRRRVFENPGFQETRFLIHVRIHCEGCLRNSPAGEGRSYLEVHSQVRDYPVWSSAIGI